MRVEYVQTDEDLIPVASIMWRRSWPSRIPSVGRVGLLLVLLMASVLSRFWSSPRFVYLGVLIGGIVLTLYLIGACLMLFLTPPAIMINWLSPYKGNGVRCGVEVSRQGLVYCLANLDRKFEWSSVTAISRLLGVYMFVVADFPSLIVVPQRVFLTPVEAERFFETACRYWKGQPDLDETGFWPPPPAASKTD